MAIKGIDVSNHQGTIDWQKVKNTGIRFAIIRAGYGGSNIDESFKRNIQGAHNAGIPVGVYWFSYALNVNDALAEAKQCVKAIQNYRVILPVFYDFEADTVSYAKKQGVTLTRTDYNAFAKKFCDYIKASGFKAGVYYNLDFKRNWVDTKIIGKYYQWLAYYTAEEQTACAIQQYSSTGKISGINGNVDLNWLINDTLIDAVKDFDNGDTETGTDSRRIQYIKRLQRALNDAYKTGLAVDGSAGPLTKKAIEQHYLYYKMPTIKNVHVGWVQATLRLLGYTIDIDNSYGPASRLVVRKFQKDNRLEVDGYAGVQTHLKIIEKL